MMWGAFGAGFGGLVAGAAAAAMTLWVILNQDSPLSRFLMGAITP